jgi:tetratricopeptide (TPR) repeat protein
MPSRFIIGCLLTIFVLTTAVRPVVGQDPRPDHNPLEAAWYVAEKIAPPADGEHERSCSAPNPYEPAYHIAKYYWRLGQYDAALRTLKGLSYRQQDDFTWRLLLEPVRLEQQEAVEKLVRQTLDTVRDKPDYGPRQYDGLLEPWLIQWGELDKARGLSEPSASTGVAAAFIKVGRKTEARELVERAFAQAQEEANRHLGAKPEHVDAEPDPVEYGIQRNKTRYQLEQLGGIGAVFFALEDAEKVEAVVQLATKVGASLEEEAVQPMMIILIRTHRFQEAMKLYDPWQNELIARGYISRIELAKEFLQAGETERAIRLLESEERSRRPNSWPEGLVEAWLAAGKPERARALIERSDPEEDLSASAVAVADWFVKRGDRKSALAMLDLGVAMLKKHPREIDGEYDESMFDYSYVFVLGERGGFPLLVDKYLELKEFDGARRANAAIPLPQTRAEGLADLARALLLAGQKAKAKIAIDEALALAEGAKKTPRDRYPLPALSRIAAVYAQLGEAERAADLFVKVLSRERTEKSYFEPVLGLAEIGFYYEQSGLKPDERIAAQLWALIDHLIQEAAKQPPREKRGH